MYEATGNGFFRWGLVDTDSIYYNPECNGCSQEDSTYKIARLNPVTLRFRATYSNAKSYKWTMSGSDQVFTTVGFALEFVPDKTPAFITISLIIGKDPNKSCFPEDDGADTLKKTIYFIKMTETSRHRLEGNYKGILKSVYYGNDEKLKGIIIPDDTLIINIGKVGFVQYNGSERINLFSVTGYSAESILYCDYSITSFSWLKSETEVQKV